MMSIDTKRFQVRDALGGFVHVRDRHAPYHLHTVEAAKIPDADRAARMSEAEYDRAIAAAVYGKEA